MISCDAKQTYSELGTIGRTELKTRHGRTVSVKDK